MGDDDGYKCEKCGFIAEGINAKAEFRDHVYRHEHRLSGWGTLRTPYDRSRDWLFLKINAIRNDFEDDDAA